MNNLDNIFKLPVYEEPIYIVVAVSDKSDIEKEANKLLGLDLESLKSHVDHVYLKDDRYFFINVLKDKSEINNPFLVRLVQSSSVILSCRYKICTNITSDKFEITEDKDTRTYSFKLNTSKNLVTILEKHLITLRAHNSIIEDNLKNGFIEQYFTNGIYTEDDMKDESKRAIFEIDNLIRFIIPDVIKNNIEIKPSINLSLKFK